LHVAPEKNLRKFFEKKYGDYFSIDLRLGVAKQVMDITHIKYADNFFDLIICSHVLEHVIDDKKAMDEFYRVLKPGGLAILQTPLSNLQKTYEDFSIVSPEAREKAFGQNDHVRIYGKDDYMKRLCRSGFKLEVFNFSEHFGKDLAEKYSLGNEEDLYVCKK
jgi:ubiquinone/menaquinone biosynthesis C-methylase UbiE